MLADFAEVAGATPPARQKKKSQGGPFQKCATSRVHGNFDSLRGEQPPGTLILKELPVKRGKRMGREIKTK